ncbi:hypothetical protein HUG17_10054 [Dermatophagoides farinae]|uniref:Nose resistant to fluoxetine protein 6-like n=1 Tax=Dermatophagoides farinae TaxID=6954 RepID=A0A9D4P3S6_DERFA|nr:hypothetical protein HUG17_10054 [Dermatophagoides farinae]
MIHERKLWATKIFNSWSQSLVPSGFISGTITDYGDYDQCLSIDKIKSSPIIPEYCLLEFEWPMPTKQPFVNNHNVNHRTNGIIPSNVDDRIIVNKTIYTHLANESSIFYYSSIIRGICLPNSCTKPNELWHNNIEIFGFKLRQISCNRKPEWPLKPNTVQLIAIFMIGLFISITFAAGLYDFLAVHKNGHSFERLLLCFSPLRNFRSFIQVKRSSSTKDDNNDLSFIHGLRFWSNVWVITAHTFVYEDWNSYKNIFAANEKLKSPIIQSLMQFINPVDVFIFIGGFLASYTTTTTTMKLIHNGERKRFIVISYIGLRYLRFTPQLIFYILLSFVLPLNGIWLNGPTWTKRMQQIQMKCTKTWWHSLIYMQNLIDPKNMCGTHTWYLAVDMQLRLLSILPLWFLTRNSTKQGLIWIKILVLASIVITSLHVFIYRLPPGLILTSLSDFDGFNSISTSVNGFGRFFQIYFKPWSHSIIYFIGFCSNCFGYLFCTFDTLPWFYGRPYDRFWSAILYPLNRTIFATILIILFELCIKNSHSIITRFLRWPLFRLFSKLTFSVYLTHLLIVNTLISSRRSLLDLQWLSTLSLIFTNTIYSYVFGFIFTILIDSPFINILLFIRKP